ncbi:SDR family NAD(P)-dependent oxidoreductase [Cohnella luojiensis]|uniref:SDR family oxidoreductase n=1 Tax=Cohnella luojiensis TaxID=652876 RepID=A0A4Y8LQE1_9BACL|nr:SDR family oxidoreductase [Cohnella luojiensis]TFE23465.1 SDR family oxidoreductase [Cohnella luojiensis]
MKLKEKVVFITEADTGSGTAFLHRLALEGAHFILNSASGGSEIAENLDRVRRGGSNVFVANADLSRSIEVNDLFREAEQAVGTVDVLIHNADLVKPALVETCDEETFLAVMNANAKSAFICTQAAGRQMRAKQSGKIIYVTSIHAEKPTGSSFAYSASKGAVKMLAREAALILGRSGVNVNTIELGPLEEDAPPFPSRLTTIYDDYRYKVPDAVLGTYGDLAELALYLASDGARYVNGADIRLDGGFLMHYSDRKMKKV